MIETGSQRWTLPALFAVLLLAALLYWPGLHGGFVHDDFGFIVQNGEVQVTRLRLGDWVLAAQSFPSAHVGRWLTMLTFAMNHYFTGLDPYWMKLTNLGLHLGNGALLFLVLRALFDLWTACDDRRQISGTRRDGVALAIAALWLVLPIHLTAVLYVSQRLESLSNLLVLFGLWMYLRARLRLHLGEPGLARMAMALLIGTGVGLLAKESAVMLPLYAACVEFAVTGLRRRDGRWQRGVIGLYLALLVLPLMVGLYWLATWVGGETSFERPYTTIERMLTEARVLVHYIGWTLLPTPDALSLYHDDIDVSRGLLQPPSTLACLLALSALAGLAFWQHDRRPLFCLGILWFFAGQLMTATVLPLELVYEHRNYFPAAGLLLALASLLVLEPLPWLRPGMATTIACAALAFHGFSTHLRAREWGDPLTLAHAEASKRPASISAQYEFGRSLVEAAHGDPASPRIDEAREVYQRCSALQGANILCEQGLLVLPERPANEARVWQAMLARLQAAPPSQNTISGLDNLWRCQQRQVCPDRSVELERAFEAALKHAHPNARLLAVHAAFAAGALHDDALAEAQLRRAVSLEPSTPVYRFNLIQLLLARRDIGAAREQIAALREQNRLGSLDEVLAHLEHQAAAIERAAHEARDPAMSQFMLHPDRALCTLPPCMRPFRRVASPGPRTPISPARTTDA